METTHKDKGRREEGGREREMLACSVQGERKRVMPLPCDWLQASTNPTHLSVSSSLVQNSWLLLLLLLARSHPLCVSLSHCQWCCASCVDLLPNQRTQGEEKTAAVEAVCEHRNRNIFWGCGEAEAKHTDWEERGLAEGMQTMTKVEDSKKTADTPAMKSYSWGQET